MNARADGRIYEQGPRKEVISGVSDLSTAGNRPVRKSYDVVIAATFTADLMLEPLEFWLDKLALSAAVRITPYAQLLQELIDPTSASASNKNGCNILLLRLEDWVRDRAGEGIEENRLHLERTAEEFLVGIDVLRGRTTVPMLVFLCPASSSLESRYRTTVDELHATIRDRLGAMANIFCYDPGDVQRLYPAQSIEDPASDRIAHIPYASAYFVALATLAARRIASLSKQQFKVIAVDCDNTLWRGVCGEDGVEGIQLTPAHLELQRMLLRQYEAGMLLCLCSKNNPEDVALVFKGRPEMPLKEEHFVSARVNWRPKSDNLRSLAEELDLALDSFILIDDSALECAEVHAHCPNVLTLQVPDTEPHIVDFVNHIWAFDRVGPTAEARRRTEQYRENRARAEALSHASSLRDFLDALELRVEVAAVQPSQLARVAELVQRTNQFNLTGIRRSAGEIESLWKAGQLHILVTHLRDRFGDYGLVGSVFYTKLPRALAVDTFVLSCRALGRGAEHRVINELGRIAQQEGLSNVELRYRETSRNKPAREFLKSFGDFGRYAQSDESKVTATFLVPVDFAISLSVHGQYFEQAKSAPTAERDTRSAGTEYPSWVGEAYQLRKVADITAAIDESLRRRRHDDGGYLAPNTPEENEVCRIFAEVLRLDRVSRRDDFFQIGGDSLRAVGVIARIEASLGLELPLLTFFEGPSAEAVAANLSQASPALPPMATVDRGLPLQLSSAQRRLWFIDQLEGGSAAYHVPLGLRLTGPLDRGALQRALDEVVSRHEILRTTFVAAEGEPTQSIVPARPFELAWRDLSGATATEREEELARDLLAQTTRPFHLTSGSLARGKLWRLAFDEHLLVIVMHHIASDGWSVGVLLSELGSLYEAFRAGRPSPLPDLAFQYADYAHWQRASVGRPAMDRQLQYWVRELQDAPRLLNLPTDRPRPAVQSYNGGSVCIALGTDLVRGLRRTAQRHGLTLAMTLFAAWSLLLSRYTAQQDLVIGMPLANRRRKELEELIGFFVNTAAVRIKTEGNPTLADFFGRVKEALLGAYANQDVPFDAVVDALQPDRTLSHNPLFQVMFAFNNARSHSLSLPGLMVREEPIEYHSAQFDLTLAVEESDAGIRGVMHYSSDLFDRETIEQWAQSLTTVLEQIALNVDESVSRLALMPETSLARIVRAFNATHAGYPAEMTLHELFEQQAAKTPGRIAVSCGGTSLTYAELNRRANCLAGYLRAAGVGPDQLVGICLDRSVYTLVGLLGVLKAGGAYVPLDPAYPPARLQHLIDDAKPRIVLAQTRTASLVTGGALRVVNLETDWSEIAGFPAENTPPEAIGLRSSHLAYVIYTSGSTGQPKGVAIEHRNTVNLISWARYATAPRDFDHTLHCTSLNFDLSVYECFVPLSLGGRVEIVANALAVEGSMELTLINTVPSAMAVMLDTGQLPASVKVINLAGEALKEDLVKRIFAASRVERVNNLYGPTETTTYSTWISMRRETGFKASIGRPIANTQIYILDEHREVVPIGVIGEIYIGGSGVARGYLHRSDLTDERFIPDNFVPGPGRRLYKTGDIGRWRRDGTIEYCGRNDHQIKIRGFRIELGEIEKQLVCLPQVKSCVVVARADLSADTRLVAYVVPRSSAAPLGPDNIEVLRRSLQEVLPAYMVPDAFVALSELPLTPNGKIDRGRLPKPELTGAQGRSGEPPIGDTEVALAEIWKALLKVDAVTRTDSFFALGGNSLLAVRMIARVRQILGVHATPRVLFLSPTLEEFAESLETLRWVGEKPAGEGGEGAAAVYDEGAL